MQTTGPADAEHQARRFRLPWLGQGPDQRLSSSRTTVCFVTIAILLVTSLVALPAFAAEQQMVLDAIRRVESGGMDDPPDGDGGAAIGPFQIHRDYWQDAVGQDPSLGLASGYSYEDCHDRFYAQLIVKAYMQRYVPKAWAEARVEVIARTHNGGPDGARDTATMEYWAKVEREFQSLSHPRP